VGGWGGASGLPARARLSGDKADNSAADAARILAETGALFVVRPGATVRPHCWCMDAIELRLRQSTVNWKRWILSGSTPAPMPDLN